MNYIAIIDSGDELSEEAIDFLVNDTIFIGDETAPYCFTITSIKQATEPCDDCVRKGQWLRMSDLSEQEDNRYKCSRCGNVVHYNDKTNLYTFNSWCGRCGSDNSRDMDLFEQTPKSGKPTEVDFCDGCVSRKAVYETIDDCNSDGLKGIFCSYADGERFKEYIKALPPVTPIHKDRTVQDFVDKCRECGKQKKGKWIFTKTVFDKHGCTVECSSCHKKWKTYDEIRWEKENKFCPNCGTKMESEE